MTRPPRRTIASLLLATPLLLLASCLYVGKEPPVHVVGRTFMAGLGRLQYQRPLTIGEDPEDIEGPEDFGLVPTVVDELSGRVLWVMEDPGREDGVLAEFLYLEGLTGGLGSNPVGLDRGQPGGAIVLRVRRRGERVLFEQVNTRFRATSGSDEEQDAVEESFPDSVLHVSDCGLGGDGAVWVDLTGFLLRDAHGSARTLARTGQGRFTVDAERSGVVPERCHVFPDNLELDVRLTFVGDEPGGEVRAVAADPHAVTLVQHHSFVRLPDPGYEPLAHDPRSGANAMAVQDYGVPLDAPLVRRWATRHRLERVDPAAASGPVREPIVYHLDRGAPEPVRSALLEGARWWADAFAAAGFEDAFRVELLPEGVHPLDARYNVIQWVHRATRGWSYGNSVVDPRTGEIVRGHVLLGSLRVRQDRLLFEGLLGVEHTGSGRPDDPVELALARLRQLSAHEVGHTLGFAHNFSASTNDRASVMDYPPPRVRVGADGALDVSEAYAVGIGAWDRVAVRWLYGQVAPGEDADAARAAVLEEATAAGLRYHSDPDARPAGAAQPWAALWDDGPDALAGLEQALAVRRVGLARFGTGNLAADRPRAELQEVLVPLYLFHRYQVDAAVKLLGGVAYVHERNDAPEPVDRTVPADEQRAALAALLGCLTPEVLELPEAARLAIAPRPPGVGGNRELFDGRTDPVFDAEAALHVAAAQVVDGMLVPARAGRLVAQAERDPGQLSLSEVLGALHAHAFEALPAEGAVSRAVVGSCVAALQRLAERPDASLAVRAEADAALRRALAALRARTDPASAVLAEEVQRFLQRPAPPAEGPDAPPEAPPGSPIGVAPGAFGDPGAPLGACSHGPY